MGKIIPDLNAELIVVSTKSMGFPDHDVKWFIRDVKKVTNVNGRLISNALGWRYDRFERLMVKQFNASIAPFHPHFTERQHVFWYNEEDARKAYDYIESQRLLTKLSNININTTR